MRLTTCGNSCDSCKAFKENYEKLDEREALRLAWKKYIDFEREPADIHCEGGTCCAIGLGFEHENCIYKECTKQHSVEHCGQCPEYPCPHMDDGRNMDEITLRNKLKDDFDIEEYEKYVKVFDNKSWINKYYRLIQK